MTEDEKTMKIADTAAKSSAVYLAPVFSMANHAATRMLPSSQVFLAQEGGRAAGGHWSATPQGQTIQLLAVAEAAKLIGRSEKAVRTNCQKGKYPGAQKQLGNGGLGWLIPVASVLTPTQHAKYLREKQKIASELAPPVEQSVETNTLVKAVPTAEYSQLWDRYERKPSNVKRMAEEAEKAIAAYLALRETGVSVGFAENAIEQSHGISRSTIRRYLDFTRDHPRQHWKPLLCPHYHGGRGRAHFTQAAYDFIVALKAQSPATKLRVLIRAAEKEGARKGWVLPSEDSIARRLKEEPAWLFAGMEALERGFPTIERDYESLELHQCWESDGRKADVFCVWQDGEVGRPFVIAIRDVRTRRVLSVRICHAPDTEAVLGAYGAALTRTRAVPAYFKLDNGREYANKAFTGHQKTRYRNKYKADEAVGILTAMNVKVHWSKPGQGRDKPIESWWNVIAENCDKAPEFAGAYCGKDVLSKPEGFNKSKAVPVEAYAAKIIETIKEYECRPHRGHGMRGRSPVEVYEQLLPTTTIRQPSPSEIRRCKMGVVSLSLDKKDSSFRFKMKGYETPMKYWAEELTDLSVSERQGKFNVHFDWARPDLPVAVYRGDVFICDAKPLGRVDFIESEGSDEVATRMADKGKHIKQRRKAINAAKAGGVIALPDSDCALSLPSFAEPNATLVIAPSVKVRAMAALVSPIQKIPGKPGESVNTETGEVFLSHDARRARAKVKVAPDDSDEEAELAELKRRQREKNVPAYLR